MKKPYFVMLRHPNGEYFLPLNDENDENAQFATKEEAIAAAENNGMGSAVGYEVFDFREGL